MSASGLEPSMSLLLRSPRLGMVCLSLGLAMTGCNVVLGINEPEEITSPKVDIYFWDGAPFGDGATEDGDGRRTTDGDASRDAAVSTPDASRPGIDATLDAGRTCSNVPLPDGGACGLGCGSLCPIGRVCLKDGDCASGRCFGTRCTLPTCTNGVKDSEEADVDCGGLCLSCGAGRACRTNADCTSRMCTNGRCQVPPVDASLDARHASDANAIADTSVRREASASPDANTAGDGGAVDAKAGDADATSDASGASDAADGDAACDASVCVP
jgi:hypothetical protein